MWQDQDDCFMEDINANDATNKLHYSLTINEVYVIMCLHELAIEIDNVADVKVGDQQIDHTQ